MASRAARAIGLLSPRARPWFDAPEPKKALAAVLLPVPPPPSPESAAAARRNGSTTAATAAPRREEEDEAGDAPDARREGEAAAEAGREEEAAAGAGGEGDDGSIVVLVAYGVEVGSMPSPPPLACPSILRSRRAGSRERRSAPPPLSCLFDRGDRKVCGAGACEGKRFLVVSSSSFSSSSSASSFRGEKNATTRDSLSKHIPSNKKRETEVSPSSSPSFLSLTFSPSLFHRQSQKQKRVKQPRARDLHKKEREEKA